MAKSKHDTAERLIRTAMDILEQLPQGGIGLAGATLSMIAEAEDEAEDECGWVDDDEVYHGVQKAWLILHEILSVKK